ncbi:MAG: glycosyltransferase [Burkholderiales bacterium]|nr:glycosyltransferase [Burkholderiales bacterium]MBK8665219.1 glycosyltransferase [Burkholderiales bacterium]
MIEATHTVVVVTPVYEDAEASSRLFRELAAEFGDGVFMVAVDDGSIRQPVEIDSLRAAGVRGVVLKLRRNVGHQRAIAIGLGYVADHQRPDQRVVVMDSDGEDLPATIQNLLAALDSPQTDVVVARRRSRVETFRFKAFYVLYKRLFGLLTGRAISFGNFMALKSHAVRRLVAMQELSIHVAGAVLASRLRMATCPLDRGPRYAGQSKMNFVGLTLHGFKGLMVFAEDVLVRVGIACALIAALSVAGSMLAIGLKLAGFSTPGWFSIALGILVLMLMQTGALALMTLMLTGVVRGGTVTSRIGYQDFIEEAIATEPGDPHP